MRTRKGLVVSGNYPSLITVKIKKKKKKKALTVVCDHQEEYGCRISKRRRRVCIDGATTPAGKPDLFDQLPDDLVLCVLSKLSSRASTPADFLTVLLTCKRLNVLGIQGSVLLSASRGALAVAAPNWSESAHLFLKRCADAGNPEACFILGMIYFYCLENRGNGASLMAKAAISSHAPALYSLAVIQFNGSGGTKNDKDLCAGTALCARAAAHGHVDALRELGHCLQDGYGVKQNVSEGRRFLVQANARELAAVLSYKCTSSTSLITANSTQLSGEEVLGHQYSCGRITDDPARLRTTSQLITSLVENQWKSVGCPLLSDFGCNVPLTELHPANRFLVDWFVIRSPENDLRLCSHGGCGKPETRKHEFRRCSVCGKVNYCSRACQALDWKIRHKQQCVAAMDIADDGMDEDHEEEAAEDDVDVESEGMMDGQEDNTEELDGVDQDVTLY